MSTENKKKEVPNQHLADKIAGKVDEKGNPIEKPETEESETDSESTNESISSDEERMVPNQHLADKIAGKVDEKGKPTEKPETEETKADLDAANHTPAGGGMPPDQTGTGENASGKEKTETTNAVDAEEAAKIAKNEEEEKKNMENIHKEEGIHEGNESKNSDEPTQENTSK